MLIITQIYKSKTGLSILICYTCHNGRFMLFRICTCRSHPLLPMYSFSCTVSSTERNNARFHTTAKEDQSVYAKIMSLLNCFVHEIEADLYKFYVDILLSYPTAVHCQLILKAPTDDPRSRRPLAT